MLPAAHNRFETTARSAVRSRRIRAIFGAWLVGTAVLIGQAVQHACGDASWNEDASWRALERAGWRLEYHLSCDDEVHPHVLSQLSRRPVLAPSLEVVVLSRLSGPLPQLAERQVRRGTEDASRSTLVLRRPDGAAAWAGAFASPDGGAGRYLDVPLVREILRGARTPQEVPWACGI